MGAGEIEDALEKLARVAKAVDTGKMNAPSFLMVLTRTEYALQMENGVYVVPLGCLKD
ncbi:MAG: hypothetical protein FWE94_05920 [Coriobacteriia bacterium]|nr:hypothetical protein [Coriobacteriia bacterium]